MISVFLFVYYSNMTQKNIEYSNSKIIEYLQALSSLEYLRPQRSVFKFVNGK